MISWPPGEPMLVDSKLLLRPWALEDGAEVFEVCQDPAIQEFTTVPVPYTREISRAFIASRAPSYLNRDVISFAGVRSGELVLSVSLHSIHEFDHVGEVGYWVKSTARGEGLATLAVRMITDFAFGIGFRRITAITLPENKASQKTLLNAGFEMETLLRQGMTKRDGSQTDAVLFAKFPSVAISD
jgi:RimJ/RimL family protein N-acetyltransferase